MTNTTKCTKYTQDPVQGLVDYVLDVKPYHTKILEVLLEYVYSQPVDITILERHHIKTDIARPNHKTLEYLCGVGYDTRPYGDPAFIPVISPNQQMTFQQYPAIEHNTKTIYLPGDRTGEMVVGAQIDLFAFIENATNLYRIQEFIHMDMPRYNAFVVYDDLNTLSGVFIVGDVITITGSHNNEKDFTIKSISHSSGLTTVEVYQDIIVPDAGGHFGLVRTEHSNTGRYTIQQVLFNPGFIDSWPGYPDPQTYTFGDEPHTLVRVVEPLTAVPPLTSNQYYTAFVRVLPVTPQSVLSYSGVHYNAPDEGYVVKDLIEVIPSQLDIGGVTIPDTGKFIVGGNVLTSNIFVGDEVKILRSRDNNGTYVITSLVYDSGTDRTTIGVQQQVYTSSTEGSLRIDVPSNAFIVGGDFTTMFPLGSKFVIDQGSFTGVYTTLTSTFAAGRTRIRPVENIMMLFDKVAAHDILAITSNTIDIGGNHTDHFVVGAYLNIVNSSINDGRYLIDGTSYDGVTDITTITLHTAVDQLVADGQVYSSQLGTIKPYYYGFGGDVELCRNVPEDVVRVKFAERLTFTGLTAGFIDDVILYNMENNDQWGYELPAITWISPTPPDVEFSSTPPVSGVYWFNTDTNVLYQQTGGSPIEWTRQRTIYWLDEDTMLFYYRTIYTDSVIIDTGWIQMFALPPGYNTSQKGVSKRVTVGVETFWVTDYQQTFTLTSHTIPTDSSLMRTYVNGVPANINVLSSTEFAILSPRLQRGDSVNVMLFADTGTQGNAFVGVFDNQRYGKYFSRVTSSPGSPGGYLIYGGNFTHTFVPGYEFITARENDPAGANPSQWVLYSVFNPTTMETFVVPDDGVVYPDVEYIVNEPDIEVSTTITETFRCVDPTVPDWFQFFIQHADATGNLFVVVDNATSALIPGSTFRVRSANITLEGIYTVSGGLTYDPETNLTSIPVSSVPVDQYGGAWMETP